MRVLGISPLDKDSTVSVLEDGRVLVQAGEERFTRHKLQSGFPWRALQAALDATGLELRSIDRVVYPFLTSDEETRLFEQNLAEEQTFLDRTPSSRTSTLIKQALARVP